jgi:Domain of unknown function (DUF4136)
MKFRTNLALAVLLGSSIFALAANVRTDYDHSANFAQIHTYSWEKVKTSDPFYADRIKQAVNAQLQAKGWQLVPSGGDVTLFAADKVHNQQEVQTMYDGLGGGWGGGWGWGRWGWGDAGGFGEATTTTTNQPVGNVVIDIFNSNTKKLLWRGLASGDISTNASKNTKALDSDIKKMFNNFPPKSSGG